MEQIDDRPLHSPTTPPDSSIEDIDELYLNDHDDLEMLDEEDIPCAPNKHFLDYDSQPPPGFEDDDDCSSTVAVRGITTSTSTTSTGIVNESQSVYPSENRKVDKKYETDGEISDFELARNSMKAQRKEKIVPGVSPGDSKEQQLSPLFVRNTGARRKKHFLDENPIPPDDYEMMDREREHRSLDRNFERTKDYDITAERKHSLDRERPKRAVKETSFTMARFLENDSSPPYHHRGGTWPADRPNDQQQFAGAYTTSMPVSNDKYFGPIPKVECVYSLLSMLGCNNQFDVSTKFLEMSKIPESCIALRQSRCIPLIVQMIHSDADEQTRKNATITLRNVVNCHPDDKARHREAKVLRHIEKIMNYCDTLKGMLTAKGDVLATDDSDRHHQAIYSLMKISFDEESRHAMCKLGALQAIASMVHYDHAVHGHNSLDERCISLRRHAAMALTNLTFGDGNNKALLCTNKEFMKALVAQLESTADDLLQVTANVLRNLSWRADNTMKLVLNEIGTVTALSHAVMKNKNENTIKALLSALWNLSAHCSTNKAEFCAVDGALGFLVDMLVYEGPSKTLTIIENSGGILRNVSSHIAVKESYRAILRQRNCLGILLQQLSSESLTIVSNACGTLWNLSARCLEDQKYLLDNKAVQMLSLLVHSKHKMISNGSSAALKNLLNCRPGGMSANSLDPIAKSMRLKELPSLNVRKQRALEQDIDPNLTETCENIESHIPRKVDKPIDEFLKLHRQSGSPSSGGGSGVRLTKSAVVPKSESKDSIVSATKSESSFDKLSRHRSSDATGDGQSTATTSNSTIRSQIEMEEQAASMIVQDKSTAEMPTPAPRRSIKKSNEDTTEDDGTSTYQETDLDQITDFSLRYGELPTGESDTDEVKAQPTNTYGSEILLILEDTVKCYETEGTPYVISNAASVSDLRATKLTEVAEMKTKNVKIERPITIESSGINTPERTTNYCEEGTPGYSIYDSYSSLVDENCVDGRAIDENDSKQAAAVRFNEKRDDIEHHVETVNSNEQGIDSGGSGTMATTPGGMHSGKVVTFETPMMFSRHSSLGSLSSVEPALGDDRSSVVSDFSRLASGIMSPSEIPDSPSQMMMPPHSPRRHPGSGGPPSFPNTPPVYTASSTTRLRSVFEDDVNTFDVENTPAIFSCATSLSNLNLDDEPKITTDSLTKEMRLLNHPSEELDEGDEEQCGDDTTETTTRFHQESGSNVNRQIGHTSDTDENDDDILASCIQIGMNSGRTLPNTISATLKSNSSTTSMNINNRIVTGIEDEQKMIVRTADDSAGSSDMDVNDSILLAQCIQDGIHRNVAAVPKPKINHSVDVPMDHVHTGYNPSNSDRSKPKPLSQHDDSLSSISIESEDDGIILSQVIAAGIQGITKAKLPTFSGPQSSTSITNGISSRAIHQQNQLTEVDSLSSIDSTDSNDTQHASLLEQCIQLGMHRQTKEKPTTKPRSVLDNENTKTISSTSSMHINNRIVTGIEDDQINVRVADDSTGSSDMDGNDSLIFAQCIRDGILRTTAPKTKPNINVGVPIMHQSRAEYNPSNLERVKPKPLTQHDDSLSSISIDSEDDGLILRQTIAAGIQGIVKSKAPNKPSFTTSQPSSSVFQTAPNGGISSRYQQTNNGEIDSLSSIDSIDSNDTQNASLLEQCIQSGMHKQSKDKPATKPRSLVSSSDKLVASKLPQPPATSSPKRSQLPTFKSASQYERDRQKERERKDEELLLDCIQRGMSKGAMPNRPESHIKPPVRHVRQVLAPTADYTQRLTNLNTDIHQALPKNGETTSVAVSDTKVVSVPYTAPGVVESMFIQQTIEGTNESRNGQRQYNNLQQQQLHQQQLSTINTTTTSTTLLKQINQTNKIGFNSPNDGTPKLQTTLQMSNGSLNLSNSISLDCSNEYPAMKLSNMDSTTDDDDDSPQHESSMEMEVSSNENGQMYQNESVSIKIDKHKDPDLMLKSVDRLTQELVSTAEYLRTASSSEMETTVYEKKSSSNSNNTWNEDTCPNDASFPSISMTVPMIASMNDDDATLSDTYLSRMDLNKSEILDEPTPTNETRTFILTDYTNNKQTVFGTTSTATGDFSSLGTTNTDYESDLGGTSQPDSLDTETRTLVNDDSSSAGSQINFQVGGEVQRSFRDHCSSNYLSSGPFSFDTTATTMTNSTIIAHEANKLVTELLNMQTMTNSSTSLDLDHIRPPSGMDTVSISGYYESAAAVPPYSPQLSRSRKKSLPLGLMARRALSHAAPSGSLESVNSSCNLDNIKPPSIMDDLLDSMISVASITSEIVDNNHGTHNGFLMDNSTYDTALSEIDDDTTTLRSCYDLPHDAAANATPLLSDFSSAESTPKKMRSIKRNLTPKQKRQIIKERYRTYTIAADMMLNDTLEEMTNKCSDATDEEAAAAAATNDYVIMQGRRSAGDGADDTVTEDMIQIEIVEESKRVTPRQRRLEDRSRFQTQVLDSTNFAAIQSSNENQNNHIYQCDTFDRYRTRTLSSQDEETDEQTLYTSAHSTYTTKPFKFTDTTSSDSNSLDDDADMSSIRALTNRFKFIRDANAEHIAKSTMNTAKPLQSPATIPATTLLASFIISRDNNELNSIDFEQNSETESCNQNNCIDEETYTVSPKAKPKIVKPSESRKEIMTETNASTLIPENKVIRGKKKAAYVSPYKKTTTTANHNRTPSSTSPKSSLPISNKTNPIDPKKTKTIAKFQLPRNNQSPIVAKTHVLLNKSNLTNKMNATRSGIAKPGFSSSPGKMVTEKNLLNKQQPKKLIDGTVKMVTQLRPPSNKTAQPSTPQMPERQGTFVKDEPSNSDVLPVVTSAPASPAHRSKLPSKLPASTSPVKTSYASKLKNPLQRSASIGTAAAAAVTKVTTPSSKGLSAATSRTNITGLNEIQKKRTQTGVFYRSPSTPMVPQRSNSNASIKSTTSSTSKREPFSTQPPSRSNSNLAQSPSIPKTSGITSRISSIWKKPSETTTTVVKTTTNKLATVGGKPPSGNRLIRSSTFDNTPNKNGTVGKVQNPAPSKTFRTSQVNGVQKNATEVVRRTKNVANSDETKRISRLGSFINVDEQTVV